MEAEDVLAMRQHVIDQLRVYLDEVAIPKAGLDLLDNGNVEACGGTDPLASVGKAYALAPRAMVPEPFAVVGLNLLNIQGVDGRTHHQIPSSSLCACLLAACQGRGFNIISYRLGSLQLTTGGFRSSCSVD